LIEIEKLVYELSPIVLIVRIIVLMDTIKPTVSVSCEINNDAPFYLYDKVKSGEKKYEVRLLLTDDAGVNNKWWQFYPGTFNTTKSTLKVVCASDKSKSFVVRVVGSHVRVGYMELIELLGYDKCVPGSNSTRDAIERVYSKFYPDYITGYKVVGLELINIQV
jgi:ASC-1-like (ASCH) protein